MHTRPISHRLTGAAVVLAFTACVLHAADAKLFTDWKQDPASAILPDFSYAGYGEGRQRIPQVPDGAMAVFPVDSFGARAGDTLDDRLAIQAAIDAAARAGGGIVRFGKGRYIVNYLDGESKYNEQDSWPVWIRSSNIILRGAGSATGGTELYTPNRYKREFGAFSPPFMIMAVSPECRSKELVYGFGSGILHKDWYTSDDTSPDWLHDTTEARIRSRYSTYPPEFILATGTSDAPRGGKTLTVNSPGRLKPGATVFVSMKDPAAARELVAPWNPASFFYINQGYGYLVGQIVTIASISGATVTFEEALKWKYTKAHQIELVQLPFLENVGVENLRLIGPIDNSFTTGDPVPVMRSINFTQVRNGWIRNVVFVNTITAITFAKSKNCTAEDCEYRIEGLTGDGQTEWEGFHNSFKFLGFATDNLMERCAIVSPTGHGFAVQEQAVGNVFLDCRMVPVTGIDLHSGLPMANLYDCLSGGRHGGSGGNDQTKPHAGPLCTFWNWVSNTTNQKSDYPGGTVEFKVFLPTGVNMIRPIVAGWRHESRPASVQYVPTGSNFYHASDTVVAEGIGQAITPTSLYRAQLAQRLNGEKVDGIYPVIAGPVLVKSGEQGTWSGAKSVGSGLAFSWAVDGAAKATGTQLQHSFTSAGPHRIEVDVTHASGARQHRSFEVWVSDPKGAVIEAQGDKKPLSNVMIHAGRIWSLIPSNPKKDDGYLTEQEFYICGRGNGVDANDRHHGGLLYTELPPAGIDISSLSYRATIEYVMTDKPDQPRTMRIAARDVSGKWAVSKQALTDGVNQGRISSTEWEPMFGAFGALSAATSFDPTKVTAAGIVGLIPDYQWGKDKRFFKFGFLELGAGASTGAVAREGTREPLIVGNRVFPGAHGRVSIYDCSGRLVSCHAAKHDMPLDLSHLRPGRYVVSVAQPGIARAVQTIVRM